MTETFDMRVNASTSQPPNTVRFEGGSATIGKLKSKGAGQRRPVPAARTFNRAYGSSVAMERPFIQKIEPHRISNTSVPEPNQKISKFGQMVSTIYQHAALPPLDPMAVDSTTADYSVALLGFLTYNYNIDMPKFSPREGEDVLFRWDRGRFSHYLTITSEGVSLMGLDPANRRRCKYDIQGEEGIDRKALADALVQATSSSTTLTVDDA